MKAGDSDDEPAGPEGVDLNGPHMERENLQQEVRELQRKLAGQEVVLTRLQAQLDDEADPVVAALWVPMVQAAEKARDEIGAKLYLHYEPLLRGKFPNGPAAETGAPAAEEVQGPLQAPPFAAMPVVVHMPEFKQAREDSPDRQPERDGAGGQAQGQSQPGDAGADAQQMKARRKEAKKLRLEAAKRDREAMQAERRVCIASASISHAACMQPQAAAAHPQSEQKNEKRSPAQGAMVAAGPSENVPQVAAAPLLAAPPGKPKKTAKTPLQKFEDRKDKTANEVKNRLVDFIADHRHRKTQTDGPVEEWNGFRKLDVQVQALARSYDALSNDDRPRSWLGKRVEQRLEALQGRPAIAPPGWQASDVARPRNDRPSRNHVRDVTRALPFSEQRDVWTLHEHLNSGRHDIFWREVAKSPEGSPQHQALMLHVDLYFWEVCAPREAHERRPVEDAAGARRPHEEKGAAQALWPDDELFVAAHPDLENSCIAAQRQALADLERGRARWSLSVNAWLAKVHAEVNFLPLANKREIEHLLGDLLSGNGFHLDRLKNHPDFAKMSAAQKELLRMRAFCADQSAQLQAFQQKTDAIQRRIEQLQHVSDQGPRNSPVADLESELDASSEDDESAVNKILDAFGRDGWANRFIA